MKNSNSTKHEHSIIGFVTVNDKGQVVIPSDARATMDIQVGDKLLVMTHPSKEGIVLIKPDGLESYAKRVLEQLSDAKNSMKKEDN